MASNQARRLIEHLSRSALVSDLAQWTDAELLDSFIERREEASFAMLLKRHGPMVWGVCRRLLNPEDAEDAFQATFLILVRRASSIVPRQMVGNWLHGVAVRAAAQVRRVTARRNAREKQVPNLPQPSVSDPERWQDLHSLLDSELNRLPDRFRSVMVLCDLEGQSRKEAARQLGVSEGTVAGWLARARAILARRFTQRGVTLSAGLLSVALAENAASATVPASVVSSTLRTATALTAGQSASEVIPSSVAALITGVLKTMMTSRLKTLAALLLVIGLAICGAVAFGALGDMSSSGSKEPGMEKKKADAPPADAGEPKPAKLEAVWQSSAGNHGKEQIQAFSPDGKLASFWHTGTRKMLARETGTWKRRDDIVIKGDGILRVVDMYKALRSDGSLEARSQLVYVGGVAKSSQITFFDPKTNKALATVDAHPVYSQPIVAFSPNGKILASASTDGVIIWDANAHRKLHFLADEQPHMPAGMVFAPDGKTLAVNSWRQVVFWDVASGKRKFALGGHIAQIWDVAVSPDGKQIATVGNDPQLIFWDPATGLNIGRVPLTTAHLVAPVAFSHDGKQIAVGDKSVVRIFDAKTHELKLELKGHTSNVQTLAFRRDGKQLASGSGGVRWIHDQPHADQGELILWDLSAGKESRRIPAHRFGVHRVAYSPDGKTLLSGGGASGRGLIVNIDADEHEKAIGVWESETGKPIRWLPAEKGYAVTALGFSPDGTMIAHNAADLGQIQLLDATTFKELRKLPMLNRAADFAFSNDGQRLAAVCGAGGLDVGKGFVQVFVPHTGKEIARRIAHDQEINCVAFMPDNTTLLTGGSDSALWMWRLAE